MTIVAITQRKESAVQKQKEKRQRKKIVVVIQVYTEGRKRDSSVITSAIVGSEG